MIGAFFSGAAGYVGMNISVRSNVRTTHAASNSLAEGLSVSFKAGAVTGMLVAGFALLSIAIFILFCTTLVHFQVERLLPFSIAWVWSIINFNFCKTRWRYIYQGADVGADLVGKVEAGIPEDDPRNHLFNCRQRW